MSMTMTMTMIDRICVFTTLLCALNFSVQGISPKGDLCGKIHFEDCTDSNAPWYGCWNVPEDLASMLRNGLAASDNPSLRTISPDNLKIDLLEYKTMPFETKPKTALFPGEAHRCLNVLKIKVRLKLLCDPQNVVYDEVITSEHVLDFDGLQYDYCRYSSDSMAYPNTPLAHAHGDFIRDLLARLERLQQKGLL